MLQHLVEFVEAANLNLYLQVESLLLQVSMTTVDGVVDTTSEDEMINLEK